MPTEAYHTLLRLNERSFDQDDLSQIGLSNDTVINYERKSGLRLCSVPPGRGRPRKFCLIDVYLLRLTSEIIIMTGSAVAAVKAVDELLMRKFREGLEGSVNIDNEKKYRSEIAADIFNAPEVFHYRHPYSRSGQSYYLYTQAIKYGFFLAEPSDDFDPINDRSMTRHRMLFFNITQILTDIDDQLDRILKDKHGVDSG